MFRNCIHLSGILRPKSAKRCITGALHICIHIYRCSRLYRVCGVLFVGNKGLGETDHDRHEKGITTETHSLPPYSAPRGIPDSDVDTSHAWKELCVQNDTKEPRPLGGSKK